MKLEDSHGGYHGKSLQEKIRDDLDEAYKNHMDLFDSSVGNDRLEEIWRSESFAEGIAHALGVLRSTSADTEWEAAEERYANPVPAEPKSDDSVQVCCPDHKRPIVVPNVSPGGKPGLDELYDPDDEFADNEFDEEFL